MQGQEGWHLRLRTPSKDSEAARKRPARHRRLLLHTSYSRKERNEGRVITSVNSSATYFRCTAGNDTAAG